MRSAPVLAVRAALLGIVLASVAGCFRPKINDGGFSCGDGGGCPDGLVCQLRTKTCVTTIHDAGVAGTTGAGGAAGKGGQGGMDAGPPDAPGPDRPCIGQVATCSTPGPDAAVGRCDPVCNTGCGNCYEKCSVNSSGDLTCNAPTTTRTPALLTACDPNSFGADQTDDCQPGQVCVNANSCSFRCYQFCRGDSDCTGGASCSLDAGGGFKMCDVPPFGCDPVNGTVAKSSCPGGNTLVGCYLSGTSTATLCDCQSNRTGMAGNGSTGNSCLKSRDCFAGLVCYDSTGHGTKQCWKVCRLPNPDGGSNAQAGETGCAVPSDCSPILLPNGTTNPTYGFCNNE